MTTEDRTHLVPRPAPGIHLVPVLHARVEIAAWVRSVLHRLDPAGVAVELPTTLEEAALRAVDRLPRITLVVSEQEGREEEEALVWTAAPGEPFAEALRWAGERGRARFFVDPDLPYTARHADPVPDPYALLELGPEAYLGPVLQALAQAPAGDADRRREAGMALHALAARRRLDRSGATGPLAVLVGAAHLRRLAAELTDLASRPAGGDGGGTVVPFGRVQRPRVEARHLHPDSLTALLPDPPLAHAAWELLRSGDLPPEPVLDEAASEPLSVAKAGLTLVSRGPGGEAGEEDRRRRMERTAALAAHRSLRARSPEAPGPEPDAPPAPDRMALAAVVWEVAARSYARQTREEVARWQRRTFFDFARRMARAGGASSPALAPGLYEWVVAARGVADDNLAWEAFEAARSYPWQEETAELPTARVDGSDLVLPDELGTRTVRFRRRHFHVKRRPVAVPVAERPRPKDPAEWLEGFSGGTLCSFPPEDLVIEDYGRFLRKRAVGILSAERTTVEPFSTSLLDGVDVRETLRHPEDPRVWVREQGRSPGKAGSVVVIFDRDLSGEGPGAGAGGGTPRYPYLMTWLGEHHDESDMAFYSTHPAEQVVGPGIMRATYGGFLMTVPPGRLFDVWLDPDYRGLRSAGGGGGGGKADVLLAAGIDYSLEKLVVHVAERPPRGALRRYAAARGKRIVHVPVGSLSPRTLKKIRVLHILVGRDKRAIAGRYVW